MSLRIFRFELLRHDVSTRMPFRYGIATMTHLPHVFIRIGASFDGNHQHGVSADHLPPKWFTKDPDRDPLDEIDDMLNVIENAGEIAQEISADNVFNFWSELYDRQNDWAKKRHIAPLLAHFGTSLVERALIDAYCRSKNTPFHVALQNNEFGIDLGRFRPELAGAQPMDWLPRRPLDSVSARHTVGLADPIYDSDIPADEAIEDGLPESLEACIGFYGLKHFKIKICGELGSDRQRIQSIAELLEEAAPPDYAFTLDGNEQFYDVASFRSHWDELAEAVSGSFFEHLLFVEQPFHRDIALRRDVGDSLRSWETAPSIIIDESDGEIDSLPRAIALGYQGTSHKNCKGVFKGVINRATINFLNNQSGAETYLMSGEDLANIGPIANHQDLVVQAALGNQSVERNGHHYFNGLSVFDRAIQDDTFSSFPSLYTREPKGVTRLSIRNGELFMKELNALPFGTSASLPNLIRS